MAKRGLIVLGTLKASTQARTNERSSQRGGSGNLCEGDQCLPDVNPSKIK